MRRVKALLLAWLSLWGLWLLLTWPPPPSEIALGAGLSLALAVVAARWTDALGDLRNNFV